MSGLIIALTLILIGFVVLIRGADALVSGSTSLARRANISDLAIGLSIVAFGTSAPELFVSAYASLRGAADISINNVLGSNIANILLILGVASVIYPLKVGKGTVWKEIPFSLMAAIVLLILAGDTLLNLQQTNVLSRGDALIFLSFFVIFLYYTGSIARNNGSFQEEIPSVQMSMSRSIAYIIAGFTGLVIGGKLIVDGAVDVATLVGISQRVIGLTIVAIGTSIPELATSVMAAYRKNVDLAVGNVIGSNIFNIFFILGISAYIRPLSVSRYNFIDLGVLGLVTLFLFLTMFTGRRHEIDRWEGVLMVIFYILYLASLVFFSA